MTTQEKVYDVVNLVSKHDLTEQEVIDYCTSVGCIQLETDQIVDKYRSL